MTASVAKPATLPDGTAELVRSWEPEGEPWGHLVIVHGLGEHSGRHEFLGETASAEGLQVVAFDLIGHGASGGRRGHIDDWTRFLDQVEMHVGEAMSSGQPVALYGHSMGGLVALDYALSERPRPHVLVLSAPALYGGAAWQRAVAPLAARMAPSLTLPTAITGEQLSRDPSVGEAYFADPLVLTKATTSLGARLFSSMERVLEAVPGLDIPTLVVHGGADTVVPPQSSLPLAELDVVERRLYPRLRHELHNEPEGPQVVGEIVGWIRGRLTTS